MSESEVSEIIAEVVRETRSTYYDLEERTLELARRV